MSIRTLIEINHDQLDRLIDEPDLLQNLLRSLAGTTYSREINEANEAGRSLDVDCGVRIVTQRHHSTHMTVKTHYAEVRL
jgi:hypothetical protein